MVSAIVLGRNTTGTTYNIALTYSTWTLYAEESDSSENGDTVAISPSLIVGVTVGDAISTIVTKISELDEISFDEKLNLWKR
jgi:hypothetical protein